MSLPEARRRAIANPTQFPHPACQVPPPALQVGSGTFFTVNSVSIGNDDFLGGPLPAGFHLLGCARPVRSTLRAASSASAGWRRANLIKQLVNEHLNIDQIRRMNLIVDTAHGFQGDERDVVFLSPCVGGGPSFIKLGGGVRYEAAELERWLKTRSRQSTSDPGTEH